VQTRSLLQRLATEGSLQMQHSTPFVTLAGKLGLVRLDFEFHFVIVLRGSSLSLSWFDDLFCNSLFQAHLGRGPFPRLTTLAAEKTLKTRYSEGKSASKTCWLSSV
jgi:hypothetical protein